MTKCPLGKGCGGTGWIAVPASDVGDPHPADFTKCECNPHAAGEPWMPLDYGRDQDGHWVAKRRIAVHETVSMGDEGIPF